MRGDAAKELKSSFSVLSDKGTSPVAVLNFEPQINMSLIFSSRKGAKKCDDIVKRDMSKKKKVIRKVRQLPEDGHAKVTTSWTVEHRDTSFQLSFSRDNLHVWINGAPTETTGYITDKGYDVDLFFTMPDGEQGHIYSDVEGHEMMNYLLIDNEIKGQEYKTEKEMK